MIFLEIDTLYLLKSESAKGLPIETISMLIALIAVFFAPILQYVISKRQLNFQEKTNDQKTKIEVLSSNRHKWLSAFRDEVSILISVLESLLFLLNSNEKDKNIFIEKFQSFNLSFSKIELLLSPEKKEHKEVIETITEIQNSIYEFDSKPEDQINIINKKIRMLITTTRVVIKIEWDKIKNLK